MSNTRTSTSTHEDAQGSRRERIFRERFQRERRERRERRNTRRELEEWESHARRATLERNAV